MDYRNAYGMRRDQYERLCKITGNQRFIKPLDEMLDQFLNHPSREMDQLNIELMHIALNIE